VDEPVMTPEQINKAFHQEVAEAHERARQRFVAYYDAIEGRSKRKTAKVTPPPPPDPEPAVKKMRRRLVKVPQDR
jgi:hypothetical protein